METMRLSPTGPAVSANGWKDSDCRLLRLRAFAHEEGATPNQIVLAWMLARTPAVIPVIANSTVAQLEENLVALALSLTLDDVAHLEGESPKD